jgi:threonine dehydrogenase-like Zn-dependent dehydrogenase
MIEATTDETIAAIHALRAAGSTEMEISDSDKERAAMKRKMDAARVIEDKRIDQE